MTKTRRKIHVLIAAGSKTYGAQIKNSLENSVGMYTCKTISSGDMVNFQIEKDFPDILVLDMMLPVFDGITVLEMLGEIKERFKLIVCFCPVNNEMFIRETVRNGADYFFVTPLDSDTFAARIHKLLKMKMSEGIPGAALPDNSSVVCDDLPDKEYLMLSNYRKKIRMLLHDVGISSKLKGFMFLEEAVIMVLENRRNINNISKVIYGVIARRFETSAATVERTIRTAIDMAWRKPGGPRAMQNVFKFASGRIDKKPTNGEMIAFLADKITVDGLK